MKEPLSSDALSRQIDLDTFLKKANNDVAPEEIIGQPRAVRALETGLNISQQGYNIFVAGAPGTGKMTAIRRFLNERARQEKAPLDWCYVNNFRDPYCPKKISLPAGQAQNFRSDIKKLIDEAREALKKAFSSEEFSKHKEDIVEDMNTRIDDLYIKISNDAKKENLAIRSTPMGIVIIPLKNGKAITEKEVQELSEKEISRIKEAQAKFNKRLDEYLSDKRKIEKKAKEDIEKLEKDAALFAIDALVKERKLKYESLPEIIGYLDEVKNDILGNIPMFLDGSEGNKNPVTALLGNEAEESLMAKYDVNILIDNSEAKGAPVIIETNPTYTNLVGKMEKESRFGTLTTSFNLIRGGALHKANGGYLVVPALELLRNPLSYESLKRCIKSKHVEIEEASDALGLLSAKTLKPEPIPLKVKVVLMGDSYLYSMLYAYDNEFNELFKIKADFDTTMELNDKTVNNYVSFITKVGEEEKLLSLDDSAMQRIIQYGCRLAEHQDKLSTRFGNVADILREASYNASLEKAGKVNASHISKAVEEKIYRSNLLQEKLNAMIKEGSVSIEIEGEKTGQVNGLAVVDIGDIMFGHPNKITVTTDMGKDGIVDIEREAKLGGPIHSKGVMILSGYLHEQFGSNSPISISARLVFEQSYSGVEGDSASSTELYAILSSLSGLPIKQGIAVTGSVNQKGDVQAVGGINEKIEGYFEVCRLKGLTGSQGVIIPAQNVKHLMLKEEVLDAVKTNKFRVWAVNSIDEGIEILTGVKAGRALTGGEFEKDSVKYLVNKRLKEITAKLKEFTMPLDGKAAMKEKVN